MDIQTIVENMTTNLMKDKGINNPILEFKVVNDVMKAEHIESYSMDELSQFVSDTIDLLNVKPSNPSGVNTMNKENLLDIVEYSQDIMNKAYERANKGIISADTAKETIETVRQSAIELVRTNFKLSYTVNCHANMLVNKLNKE